MRTKQEKTGFILPLAVAMIGIMTSVGIIVIQSTVQSQRNVARHGYQLMARQAAKSGADFAKERFEADPNYNGTAENRNTPCSEPGVPAGCDINSTVLYNSTAYQTDFSVEVLSTSGDGQTKNIRAIGKVYIPDIALNAAFVQDIRTAIIRRGVAVAGNPTDFSPVLWLDSSDATTLEKDSVTTTNRTYNIAQVLEERTNGSVASSSCSSADIEMSTQGENSGTQNIGLRFTGVDVPKDAVITNAYVQFVSDSTKQSGGITLRTRAIAANNLSAWSCPANNQLNNASKTTAYSDWSPADWNINGQSGSAQQTTNITSVIQEIVNRGGWNSGNALGLHIAKQSGSSGVRTAKKGAGCSGCNASDVRLFIEWQTGSSFVPAADNDVITRWKDKSTVSGGGRDVTLISGDPRKRDNTLNGLPVVEFYSNGNSTEDILGNLDLGAVLTSRTAATILAVMKPITTGGGGGDDRYVTFVRSSSANETQSPTISSAIRAFYRSGSTTTLTTAVNGLTAQPLSGVVGSSFGSASWGLFANRFSNTDEERFSNKGLPVDTYNGGSSLSYNVNQILLGGTSSSTGNYVKAGDFQLAELIVYNKELSCEQIETLETYLQTKWSVTTSTGNCAGSTPLAY